MLCMNSMRTSITHETETLKLVYFPCFHPVMSHGIIFCRISTHSEEVFYIKKKIFLNIHPLASKFLNSEQIQTQICTIVVPVLDLQLLLLRSQFISTTYSCNFPVLNTNLREYQKVVYYSRICYLIISPPHYKNTE